MSNDSRERLRNLLDKRSLIFPEGGITLASGTWSPFYFNSKTVTLSPEGAPLVAEVFLDSIDALPEQPTAIGGLAIGACPIVGAIMMQGLLRGRKYQTFYVRKERKEHGTKLLIENPPPAGSPVVIVDDVVTQGNSMVDAILPAEKANLRIITAIAMVDREAGGAAVIRKHCPQYEAIFTLRDFPRIAEHDARRLAAS